MAVAVEVVELFLLVMLRPSVASLPLRQVYDQRGCELLGGFSERVLFMGIMSYL
jgi:hypothetical protein